MQKETYCCYAEWKDTIIVKQSSGTDIKRYGKTDRKIERVDVKERGRERS